VMASAAAGLEFELAAREADLSALGHPAAAAAGVGGVRGPAA
jgi:hypothetical protein